MAKKIYKCCFIWFFHFLKNCNDVYVMYCLPVGCNNKKKMELQQFCFPLIIRWRLQPKQHSVTSLSKLKVKYSQAFPGSNITLSSSSMQPPVASRAGFVRRDFLICSQGWPQSLTSHIPINMGLIIAVPLLPVNYSFTYSNHLSSICTIKDKLAPTAPYPLPPRGRKQKS